MVQIYSVGYMHGDKRYPRYFAYLSLFSAAMLALVIANNILLMFMAWELVGSDVVSADRVLVREAVGDAGSEEGVFGHASGRCRVPGRA